MSVCADRQVEDGLRRVDAKFSCLVREQQRFPKYPDNTCETAGSTSSESAVRPRDERLSTNHSAPSYTPVSRSAQRVKVEGGLSEEMSLNSQHYECRTSRTCLSARSDDISDLAPDFEAILNRWRESNLLPFTINSSFICIHSNNQISVQSESCLSLHLLLFPGVVSILSIELCYPEVFET